MLRMGAKESNLDCHCLIVLSSAATTNSSRIGAKLITENKSAEKKTWNGIGSEARTSNATLEPIHKEPRNTHLNSVQ